MDSGPKRSWWPAIISGLLSSDAIADYSCIGFALAGGVVCSPVLMTTTSGILSGLQRSDLVFEPFNFSL